MAEEARGHFDAEAIATGQYQLVAALLDVLTRQLGPNFAGAVREELLARIDSLEKTGTPNSRFAAAQAREVAAQSYWHDLTGRRPLWTKKD